MAETTLRFTVINSTSDGLLHWYADNLQNVLLQRGHTLVPAGATTPPESDDGLNLVLNLTDLAAPRSFQRNGQGTFVVSLLHAADPATPVMRAAYPALVRSLSNMVLYLREWNGRLESHFITIEQGHATLVHGDDDWETFAAVYERIAPLAASRLMINNEFVADLPAELWAGDAATAQLAWAGQRMAALGLLPAAFPIHEYLSERELRHVRRLYGLGGLSYGNLSCRARHNPGHFWMSASGVNKGTLQTIGRDMLLVTGFDAENQRMRLSVPPGMEPRRVSVDAIEHLMIYREHPAVGAIVHMHAWWRDPIPSTQVNYPCGTIELAQEVAELVRHAPDPSRAVIGLKNHGLTITGHSLEEIFQRIEGNIVRQIPMV
ncbi:MAG: class II aldolase/adducin family protein [Chloroflexaceae bacterium]|jgi:ribulose-5-phosphate 4-epimerase/fuculose-1-phosphate aldolase|nr:class II aldolase/adducin family protein [Chloroflexaceae bacterium]